MGKLDETWICKDCHRTSDGVCTRCPFCGSFNREKIADPDKRHPECPKCGSKNVTSCPGGTCLKPIPGIKWICIDCLYEW